MTGDDGNNLDERQSKRPAGAGEIMAVAHNCQTASDQGEQVPPGRLLFTNMHKSLPLKYVCMLGK